MPTAGKKWMHNPLTQEQKIAKENNLNYRVIYPKEFKQMMIGA